MIKCHVTECPEYAPESKNRCDCIDVMKCPLYKRHVHLRDTIDRLHVIVCENHIELDKEINSLLRGVYTCPQCGSTKNYNAKPVSDKSARRCVKCKEMFYEIV